MNSENAKAGRLQKLFEEKAAELPEDKRVRLLSVLTDSVQFYIKGSKERFFIAFDKGDISCVHGIDKKPGVSITISESDLEAISDDRLNPQIAMISDKVNVEGKTALALYVFNILTE